MRMLKSVVYYVGQGILSIAILVALGFLYKWFFTGWSWSLGAIGIGGMLTIGIGIWLWARFDEWQEEHKSRELTDGEIRFQRVAKKLDAMYLELAEQYDNDPEVHWEAIDVIMGRAAKPDHIVMDDITRIVVMSERTRIQR